MCDEPELITREEAMRALESAVQASYDRSGRLDHQGL
jgi:hypothetical protein